jgi:peptidoglycan/xylan/chitin deacetylase (PgdA/CDA1 family)
MRIAVTVDLENDLGSGESRYGVEEGLPVILDLFERYGVSATFFVSGMTLDYLMKSGALTVIGLKGHEIASHGHSHADYRPLEGSLILDELKRSKQCLEDGTGREVIGFRAPQFLLDGKVLDAVRECGFRYDSSLPDPSGLSVARHLRKVRVDDDLLAKISGSGVQEFPIDSLPGLRVPHGLLWVNLVSFPLYKVLFDRMRKEVITFYLHPFDIIRHKERIPLDLKRKLFYLKGGNDIPGLLEGLLTFWRSRGTGFMRLCDLLTHK